MNAWKLTDTSTFLLVTLGTQQAYLYKTDLTKAQHSEAHYFWYVLLPPACHSSAA